MNSFYDITTKDGGFYVSPDTNDIVIGESDIQHIEDIAISFRGEWKQYPFVGTGIGSFLKLSNPIPKLLATAQLQYTGDGYVSSPQASFDASGDLSFNANAYRK